MARAAGTNPSIGVELPHDFPLATDYEDRVASAMTPILGAYWDESGKRTMARLGLDPDDWKVTDPNLHEKIRAQVFDFTSSTLQTTDLDIRQAYRELQRELLEGLGYEGETIPQLTKRVKAIFQDAATWKAEQIARTEASRAVNAASLESAKQSGVVARKKWLLSTNACQFCHEIADRVNAEGGVPLDEAFAVVPGGNPVYSTIICPPAHPSCRCSTTLVLNPEYQAIVDANPPQTWQPGAMGPEE